MMPDPFQNGLENEDSIIACLDDRVFFFGDATGQ